LMKTLLTSGCTNQRGAGQRTGHGPQMLVKKKTNPSSSVIGRLRDQSEIRGVEVALKRRSFLQD
ncbi:mannonate dehydratase, partial [Klebsiella pneumoniae]